MNRQLVGALISIVIAAAVFVLPTPSGLDPAAHRVLAIIALAVGFWAADVLNSGVTAVCALGLLLISGVAPAEALSGFSAPAF